MAPGKLEELETRMGATVRPVCAEDELATSEFKDQHEGGGVPHIVLSVGGQVISETRGDKPLELLVKDLTLE